MSKLGKQIIRDLKEFLDDVKNNRPVKITNMRRMVVKGKVVYVDETYHAPFNSLKKIKQNRTK